MRRSLLLLSAVSLLPALFLLSSHRASAQATQHLLYTFCAQANCPTGESPDGSVFIQAADGNLYIPTAQGGASPTPAGAGGTVVRLSPPTTTNPTGVTSLVYSFCSLANCADGAGPETTSLTQGSDGNLYGLTDFNGVGNPTGTAFKLTPAGAYTLLHTFCSITDANSNCVDGGLPTIALVRGTDGNFYGTTYVGGNPPDVCGPPSSPQCGTVFQLTPGGQLTTLYNFCSNFNGTTFTCLDGAQPDSSLVQGPDGLLYGTTTGGGAYGAGTVFSITTGGSLTTLYSFCAASSPCPDGAAPQGNVVFGKDGNLYGLTAAGGNASNAGTFYRFNPSSKSLNTLYAFCSSGAYPCPDGLAPEPNLLLGADGNFYGSTAYGGVGSFGGYGVVFTISYSGQLAVLHAFCSRDTSTCSDGIQPNGLFEGSDGVLFGSTFSGGAGGGGVLYDLTFPTPLPAPVQLSLSETTVAPGTPVTLDWSVLNAFSQTMQQCYAFVQNAATGAGSWSGLQTGTLSDDVYSGSTSITPTATGTYTYALTCGGVESGFATLNVARNTTHTTFSITPNPALLGDKLTATVTVTNTSGSGTPTGSVSVYNGRALLETRTLNGGSASMLISTVAGDPTGTFYFTADYLGDATHNPSSGTLTFVITAAPKVKKAVKAAPSLQK